MNSNIEQIRFRINKCLFKTCCKETLIQTLNIDLGNNDDITIRQKRNIDTQINFCCDKPSACICPH